ncbi:hypothetical protein GEMRC1_010351 [Eukaryota sp. GEM-RC1]
MTSLPSEEWKTLCEVVEVVSSTCARFRCKLCDVVHSVDLPKKRPISLCSNIGPPGSQNALNVAALRRYVETHSRGRKRKASQQSTPETKRNDLQPFLSPVPEPPVDESSTVVVISESDPNTSSLSPTSAVTAIPQPTIETTIPIATSPQDL